MGDRRYDVFLSHHSADTEAAIALAEALADAGLTPWLDRWCLPKGGDFQAGIADGLRSSGACAVLVGPKGLGNWVRLARARADRAGRSDPKTRP